MATSVAARFPLHVAVWRDSPGELRRLLRGLPRQMDPRGPGGIDEYDNHGNTALHLCLILGRRACLETLLKYGNPDCRLQSRDGWSPLAEAVSLGNRDMIHAVLERRTEQTRAALKLQMPLLYERLQQLGDFRLEMHWHFTSWIPFVSSLCPSDTNVIYKKGKSVRLDTTIAGFERMHWIRGNLSLIVLSEDRASAASLSTGEMKEFLARYGVPFADCVEKRDLVARVEHVMAMRAQQSATSRYGNVYMLNHDKKLYAVVSDEVDTNTEMESLVNVMMTAERTFTQFNRQKMRYQRAKSGFWGFQSDRHERIGQYQCDVWEVSGVELVTKVRLEHLDAAKSMNDASCGQDAGDAAAIGEEPSNSAVTGASGNEITDAKMQAAMASVAEAAARYHPSLPAPAPPTIDMDAYFDSERTGTSTHPDTIGRALHLKARSKTFGGRIWTSRDFPLQRDDLLAILKTIAPSSHLVQKIVDFLELSLPPGFPVRLEVPVLPMLTVQVTFQNFQPMATLDPELFSLRDYIETDRVL